jgi:23S rRNA (adenine(2503)-C(2))-methyltransferase
MNIQQLEKILTEHNQPKFRLSQILKAVYQDGASAFSEISVLPKELREILDKEMKILSFEVDKVLVSRNKDSHKALLKLSDNDLIETVLMSSSADSWSVCVSSQVGCPMGCRFCATGKMGFRRNLTAEEIADQVLFWRQYLKKFQDLDVSNVVYMGMGEPFLNWENVSESLKILTDKNLLGLGSRSISISTSGVTEGIEKMAREFPQVNLAISLHFADDQKRSSFMPVNQKDNLEKLKQALNNYFELTNRQVFLEYIMLNKINDTPEDAKKLASYVRSVGKLQLLHVNLIRYNTTSADLKPSSREKTEHFKEMLAQNGISATIRKSLGEEIKGACGQLAGE